MNNRTNDNVVTVDNIDKSQSTRPIVPTPEGITIEEQIESNNSDAEWFATRLHHTCASIMREESIRRQKITRGLDTYRNELESVSAPANGPSPHALKQYLDDRELANYPRGMREVINTIDSLVEESIEERQMTAPTIRRGIYEYVLVLDYLLEIAHQE